MPHVYTEEELIPSVEDFEKILTAKLSYEAAQKKSVAEAVAWSKKNFALTPWGISYNCSKHKYEKSVANAKSRGWSAPKQKTDDALRYFIVAVVIDWQELIDQLKLTIRLWDYTTKHLQAVAKVWQKTENAQIIAQRCASAKSIKLVEKKIHSFQRNKNIKEDVEKNASLNKKLFTQEGLLKEKVRDKMLEIVDEFLADLKEQDIKIKVDDILLIGSNASYNYTKDSDIDLHVIANSKATEYSTEIANALYSAYRSLFNKKLDINIYNIPLEIFVEIEDTPRVSNGIYSVKKDKWIKKPVLEDIPEYDKEALNKLVTTWETKCKELIDDIKNDKLKDEKKVVKLLSEIYEKLRKKGVAKSEYSLENLAFKELRNKGYLDKLKNYRNDLISKRLSLEENLDALARKNIYDKISQIAFSQPIIQDNGLFFIYNIKASDVSSIVQKLRALPEIVEVSSTENGKYDFSDINRLAMGQIPAQYYNIRGKISL